MGVCVGPEKARYLPVDDPIEVAVLHALVVLVLVGVERLVDVPAVFDRHREAGQAVLHGDGVRGRTERGVAVGDERGLHVHERCVRLLRVLAVRDQVPARAEQDRIGARVRLRLADMVDTLTLQLRVVELMRQHAAVAANLCDVQRAKVAVVRITQAHHQC